jgi:hypothetical protein
MGWRSKFPFVCRYREGLQLRRHKRRRGCIQQHRRLERTAMQAGYLLEMLLAHTFDTGICRMDGQRHIDLFEPVVERLGMNAKQTSTVCDRKKSHAQNSFRGKNIWETTRAQISRNSSTSRKFLGCLGNERWKEQSREECCESQPGSASL